MSFFGSIYQFLKDIEMMVRVTVILTILLLINLTKELTEAYKLGEVTLKEILLYIKNLLY